jgi:Ca-activated chloride channel family protein
MNFFSDITFLYPWLLYSLIILPVLIFWHYKQSKKQQTELRISTLAGLSNYQASTKQKLRHLPYILRLITIGLLIVCLARPQSSSRSKDVTTEGIDIMLAMDISGSMLAEDFKPNRIEAAKKVAIDFVDSRINDRIGLVIFSGESFTQCPLTTDHAVVKNQLAALQSGMVADGTAIGEGFATAVNRLKDSKAKSKVIILLTDGVNNSGSIAPITAAEIAKTFGIRTYCIGVGTIGTAPYPMKTPFGIQYQQMEVQIDEATMTSIAEVTGGKYFRATNNKSLKKIYDDIDKLEKTKIEVTEFSRHAEEFLPFAIVAAILLLLEIVLRYTVFRSIP